MTQEGMARWLEGLPDDRLTALVDVRLGRVARLPSSFDQLAALLSQVQSCEEALRRLDRTTVQVVALLAEAGGRLPAAELAARLGVDGALVAGALERAAVLALAWPVGTGEVWRTPGGMAHLAGPVLRRGLPYSDLLPEMPLSALRTLLRTHDLGGARATWDAVDVLCQVLPRTVPELLAAGPDGVVEALSRLVRGEGEGEGEAGPLGWAQEQGLLLSIADGWFVPAEVEQAVRGDRLVLAVEHPPPRVDVAPARPPVAAVLGLLTRVDGLLAALESNPPTALASGGLGVKELRRLAKAVDAELADLVLLLQLAAVAGLVGTGQRAGTLTAAGRSWRRLPEEQAYARLVVPQLHPQAVLEPPGTAPSGVLLTVARSGYGRVSVRDLARAVVARGPESDASLVAGLDWSAWRRGDRSARQSELDQPLRVLELLGLRAHGTPAPWLSALLGVDQPGLLEVDEVGLARAATALTEHLPPAQEDVVLQADGTAFVAGRADPGLRRLLDQLGRRESDHTWRLWAQGVREALDAGRTGEDLLAELRRRSRHDPPTVIEQLVRDVARGHGRIRLHAATTVLRLDDPVLAVELLHDRRLAPLALVEVAPGVLASAVQPAKVAAALRQAGHAPVGDGAAPPKPPAVPRARSPRPVVPQRAWGHPAQEIVAALRAGPARSPQLQPAAETPRATPRAGELGGLVDRLQHLTGPERMLLVQAVIGGGPVELDYVDADGKPTTRVVHGFEDTGHLLLGWCRLRQDERMFAPRGILAVRPAS